MKKHLSVAPANPVSSIIAPLTTKVSGLAPYAWWFAIAIGMALRVLFLSDRPLHHDESIHGTFSYYWYDHPDTGYYKYDPTYHGPFLYFCTRWLFVLFGVGTPQARLFPLIFGTAVMLLPMLFQRYIGRRTALISTLALALSPLFSYYARFLIHDMPSIFFGVTCLWGLCQAATSETKNSRNRWYAVAGASMGIALSIKAVAFLYGFLIATGFAWVRMTSRTFRPSLPNAKETGWMVGALLLTYAFFQTSGFRNLAAFPQGLFGSVFSYWWGQHRIERVAGPGIFHLRNIALHELPILLVALAGLGIAAFRRKKDRTALLALGFFAFVVLGPSWKLSSVFSTGWLEILKSIKVKYTSDLLTYPLCAFAGLVGSYRLARAEKTSWALLTYWSFASLAIYSYAGEKGPWLTVHVLFPFTLLACAFAVDWYENRAETDWRPWLLAAGCAAMFWQARTAYYVTHWRAGEATELLSQVHNQRDVVRTMDWMKREAFETGEKPARMPIAIVGEPVWAFFFYLIENGFKTFVIDQNRIQGTERFIIADDKIGKQIEGNLRSKGYQMSELDHSGWWVPEDNNVQWGDWVRYWMYHVPAGNTGMRKMFVFYRPNRSLVPPATADGRTPSAAP